MTTINKQNEHMGQSKHLVLNRIKTPDGTILTSYHRHDYVTHIDDISGETYMIDGGLEYIRRSMTTLGCIELSVYDNAPHEKVRDSFHWGTRGKDGRQPLTFKVLKDLDTDHIEAIMDTQKQIPLWVQNIFERELAYRINFC